MNQTDGQLVKQTLQGNLSSFDLLFQRYRGIVYGLTYHWTRNLADAQDLTQETFYRAYEKLGQLRDPEKFAVWLRRIATNMCRRWQRGLPDAVLSIDAPENQNIRDELQLHAHLPEEVIEAKEQQHAVEDILNQLSDKVRLTTTLFYIDEFSYQEISDFLEVPVSTVKGRLYKARKQLKEEAIQMVEDTLGQQKDKPKIEIKKVSGYVFDHEEGFAYLRPTANVPSSSEDIRVSESDLSWFGLKAGDFVHGYARPATDDQNNLFFLATGFTQINDRPAVSKAPELKVKMDPMHTNEVEQVIQIAREEAFQLGEDYIGTEHLLLGILYIGKGQAEEILSDLNLKDLEQTIKEDAFPSGKYEQKEDLPLTPRTRQTLQAATNEAGALSAEIADVEHLLLALARDKNGAAARLLWEAGMGYDAIKEKIMTETEK